ncbi:MAG: nucleotidyltransferase domain-containing protein [Actinomycetota bacterium]|nr:nucleotidyltransferase domain-containing protein [Actinomycetota bacterium]
MQGQDSGIRAGAHIDGALLEGFLASLREKVRVASVVVFGSRARGEALEESDYDLLVISPDFGALSIPDRAVLLLEAWPGRVALEPVALTPEEFARAEGALMWDILHEGTAVVDDGTFDARRRLFRLRLEKGELRKGEGYWSFS